MAASAVQSSEDERLTWDEIEKVVNADVVRSVMTSRVLSIGPDASVFDAMKLLVDNRISAVPVVDGDRQVLGVVSEYDLMARVGTSVQAYKLKEEDFRAERYKDHTNDLKGNNDILVLTRPDVIKEIHSAYLAKKTENTL